MADDGGEVLGILILGAVALVVVVLVIIYVIIPAAIAILTLGGLWGGGHAVVNYARALRQHVSLERPWK